MIIYGLMKFIEQIPERYDRMIGFLTLGGHKPARRRLLGLVRPGMRVLDLGCGTGSFLLAAARKGAICTGIDASLAMLAVAEGKLAAAPELRARVTLRHHSASLLGRACAGQTFDLVCASLMLGELPDLVLQAVLRQVPALLAPGGRFAVIDELWPEGRLRSVIYNLILAITFVPNFILTRTMIRPVHDLPRRLAEAGLAVRERRDFAGGVVTLLLAERAAPAGAGA